MNIYLYYRTYWGDPKSVGMSGRNILAKNKMETIDIDNIKIPHVGFNQVSKNVDSILFQEIIQNHLLFLLKSSN